MRGGTQTQRLCLIGRTQGRSEQGVGGKEGERALTHSGRTGLLDVINSPGLGEQMRMTSNLANRER